MSQPRHTTPLPITTFLRSLRHDRDPIAIGIAGSISLFAVCVLSLPFSAPARVVAMQRFHLAGWNYGAWALFQPVPSMYNFDNRWDVTFTRPEGSGADDDLCQVLFHGHINHHVFNRVLLRRAELERCGLPAQVHFRTVYRGTGIETGYLLAGQPGRHGFSVTPGAP